jgi:hypothetical protein
MGSLVLAQVGIVVCYLEIQSVTPARAVAEQTDPATDKELAPPSPPTINEEKKPATAPAAASPVPPAPAETAKEPAVIPGDKLDIPMPVAGITPAAAGPPAPNTPLSSPPVVEPTPAKAPESVKPVEPPVPPTAPPVKPEAIAPPPPGPAAPPAVPPVDGLLVTPKTKDPATPPLPAVTPSRPPAAACPWTFQMKVVDGRTVLTARTGDEVQFKVICDRLEMQAPHGSILAVGAIMLSSSGLDGSSERLTINLQEDRVTLDGGARLQINREHQELALQADHLSLRIVGGRLSEPTESAAPPSAD